MLITSIEGNSAAVTVTNDILKISGFLICFSLFPSGPTRKKFERLW